MDIACELKSKLSTLILKAVPEREVALLLSGGVDSIALLLLLKELGYKVTTYTFHIAGESSTDLVRASHIASLLEVPNIKIRLSNKLDLLIADLMNICRNYPEAKSKTDFECFWTLSKAFDKIPEKQIITGLGCDGHFGTSKKAMIHYKDDPERFKAERLKAFRSPKYAQLILCSRYEELTGKKIFSPYRAISISTFLANYNWYELNKPRQKWPIVDMFKEEFKILGAPKHTNFQKGDSGIDKLFEGLVRHPINVRGLKSSTGIFNQIKDIIKDENVPGALPYRSQGSLGL